MSSPQLCVSETESSVWWRGMAKRLCLVDGSLVTLPSAGIDPTQFLRAQDVKKKAKPGPSSLWLLSLAWALFFPNVTMMSCAPHRAAEELSSEQCGGQCCAVSPVRNCEPLPSPFIKHYVAASILLWQWKRPRYLLYLWIKKMTLSLRPSWILTISKDRKSKSSKFPF